MSIVISNKVKIILLFIQIAFASVCDVEINTDRPYNDFAHYSLRSSAACCALCNDDFRCQAWTNVANGDYRVGCYLKNITPPKNIYDGPVTPCGTFCSSGRKPIPANCSNFEYNTDRQGSDFLSAPYCDGPESCCAACEARTECKSWTYVLDWAPYSGCYLKSKVAPIDPSSRCGKHCTSGVKNYKMSHSVATNALNAVGISVYSSGGCSTRSNPACVSFEQINVKTIDGLTTLRRFANCPIIVTGGTEEGHADDTYSHYNGYKVDIILNDCINNYITSNFQYIGLRSDGAQQYKSSSGNIYAKEGNHWDILYY